MSFRGCVPRVKSAKHSRSFVHTLIIADSCHLVYMGGGFELLDHFNLMKTQRTGSQSSTNQVVA